MSKDEPDIMKILDDLYSGKDISKYYPEEKNNNPLSIPLEDAELLIAAFYSEREKLQGKLDTVIDLRECSIGFDFEITPHDILIMHRDAHYGMYRKKMKHRQTTETLKFFNIPENAEVDYYKYLTAYLYLHDDDWVDESDKKEFLAKGYKAIDIELINCGVKCQLEKVKELLEKGANLYASIEPYSKSELLCQLSSDNACFGIQYFGFLEHKSSEIERNDEMIEFLIKILVATASSNRMYRFLMGEG
jgi:hypothetical protein